MTGTSTLGMTRADWLAARRTGIGGSDAAAFTREGYKATTLAAMNPDPPRYYHTRLDTVENMRPECITVGIDIMTEVLCAYDKAGLPELPEKT